MMREMIDEYLDGSLDPARRAEVERTLAADPEMAALLARMEAERAARASALESYLPSAADASAFAAQVLAACAADADAPVGRIVPQPQRLFGRLLRVAAAIAVAAGLFVAGRASAPSTPVEAQVAVEKADAYSVVYVDPRGALSVREFATKAEQDEFVRTVDPASSTTILAVADNSELGHM